MYVLSKAAGLTFDLLLSHNTQPTPAAAGGRAGRADAAAPGGRRVAGERQGELEGERGGHGRQHPRGGRAAGRAELIGICVAGSVKGGLEERTKAPKEEKAERHDAFSGLVMSWCCLLSFPFALVRGSVSSLLLLSLVSKLTRFRGSCPPLSYRSTRRRARSSFSISVLSFFLLLPRVARPG